jgi:hypothetical protein
MALCPFAVQRPVSAHGGPIGLILGCVEHVTAGEGDPYNEFANPLNQVSSHFGIGNGQGGMGDGLIEQYDDTGVASWAQASGNSDYLSVETEGVPGDPLTQNQVLSFGKLYAWMHQVHGIPLAIADAPGQRGLIGHGEGGYAWGGHLDCPGPARLAQRSQILYIASLIIDPPAPSPAPSSSEETMIARNSGPAGGLWGVRANANIYTFKDAQGRMAPYLGPLPKYTNQWGIGTASNPITGIVDDGVGGFFLECDSGGASPSTYHITADAQYAR